MQTDLKIGIIGGSGMEDPTLIQDYSSKTVSTSYGDPSSELIIGNIAGILNEKKNSGNYPCKTKI